jgi:hypothetical protein
MSGNLLGLVPRRSVSSNGTKVTWTGRLRITASIPDQFKIIVEAIDRAGNVAVVQEVTVTVTRGRGRGRDEDAGTTGRRRGDN